MMTKAAEEVATAGLVARSSAPYSGSDCFGANLESHDLCSFAPRIPMVQPTQPRNRNYGGTVVLALTG